LVGVAELAAVAAVEQHKVAAAAHALTSYDNTHKDSGICQSQA
jgi:hypothetical protein